MALLGVTDRGDSFKIWRVAANILNKHSRTADKGRYYSVVIWQGANILTLKKTVCYEMLHRFSDLDLSNGKWKHDGKVALGRPRRRWEDNNGF